ncbi:hypothetical protein LZ32DRAFT_112138 [Colletotrichum eremochloae]|nr:hypothetical protein LZ32DRAFT_112138 [Colletotrichum eremochloae]
MASSRRSTRTRTFSPPDTVPSLSHQFRQLTLHSKSSILHFRLLNTIRASTARLPFTGSGYQTILVVPKVPETLRVIVGVLCFGDESAPPLNSTDLACLVRRPYCLSGGDIIFVTSGVSETSKASEVPLRPPGPVVRMLITRLSNFAKQR